MDQLAALAEELQALIKKSEQTVYTVAQVATILDCTQSSVEAHLRTGRLPGLKFGRSWVVPVEAFNIAINALALDEAALKQGTLAKARQDAVVAIQVVPQPARGRRRQPPDLTRYMALLDAKN